MKTPLYKKIYDDIYFNIKNGKYPVGTVLPSEPELCEIYKVSRVTIRHSLDELRRNGFIVRTKKKGTTVLPTIEKNINRSDTSNTQSIAFVFPFFDNYGKKILDGLSTLRGGPNHFVCYDSKSIVSVERDILQRLLQDNISALVLMPTHQIKNFDIISEFAVRKIPMAFFDSSIAGMNIPCIRSNNYAGTYALTEHLIRLGHTRIAYFRFHESMTYNAELRFKGYAQALIQNGLRLHEELIFLHSDIQTLEPHPELEDQIAHQALEQFFASKYPPTAIVCLNDLSACSVYRAANEMGISVPENLAITGFDNTDMARNYNLTTVSQNFGEIARRAIEVIHLQRRGFIPPEPLVDTIFIERESVLPLSRMMPIKV